jgi:hypothetical protein
MIRRLRTRLALLVAPWLRDLDHLTADPHLRQQLDDMYGTCEHCGKQRHSTW